MIILPNLCDDILRAAYNCFYKGGVTVSVRYDAFCRDNHIRYVNDAQLSMAMDSLKNDGYIDITPFIGNSGSIDGITAAGVNYVETMLR